MLDSIRNTVPESARATWYAVAVAIVSALVAWGYLDQVYVAALTGVVGAAITLAFAIIHSSSPWRVALYGLMGAVGVLAVTLGWGSQVQIDAVLAIAAPVLGIGAAAATTTVGDAAYVGEHRLEN